MRLPIPSRLVERWIRRLAGVGPAARLLAVRIYPRSIEIALEQRPPIREEVHVVPQVRRRWLLLALAPLLFVTLAPRARLHVRLGGLPYVLDALLATARRARRVAREGRASDARTIPCVPSSEWGRRRLQ
jgi:hypothetical protein